MAIPYRSQITRHMGLEAVTHTLNRVMVFIMLKWRTSQQFGPQSRTPLLNLLFLLRFCFNL